jgi:hypothetical protein
MSEDTCPVCGNEYAAKFGLEPDMSIFLEGHICFFDFEAYVHDHDSD